MRLKVQLSVASHSEAITGVDWISQEQVISASDDHGIWIWSTTKLDTHSALTQIEDSNFPTSLQFSGHSAGNAMAYHHQHNENGTVQQSSAIQKRISANLYSMSTNGLILITTSNGNIHLMNMSGNIEKTINAHQGAVIMVKWSGAEIGSAGGFASCGEDGCVKMWSRNGMLRSVFANVAKPVYCLDWNKDSSKVAYCSGEECFIKMLNAQTLPIKWHAHTGLVLCLSWSAINDQIVTGGEDCRYRLWDTQGHPLWSSASHGFPICSVSWSPNGQMFAIGAFNLLRLCDCSGWSHSLERPNIGSIYCLSWSFDGTQLVGGCANGQLLHAHIVEKRLMWEQLEAVQIRQKVINIRDLSSEVAKERLETRDRVIRLELGFNFLVVVTTKQCYIFSAKNWNTPVVMDLKENAGLVSLIRLCEKCFLMVDSISVQVWNYEGRVLSNIRLPTISNAIGEPFNEQTAAISNDLVVLRDRVQHTIIHLFDPQTGKTSGNGEIMHNANIVELCVNQCGGMADRRVAFVDSNGDCFLALVNCYGANQRTAKIGSLISCLAPNNTSNMLGAIQDNQRLLVWTIPTVVFTDKKLLIKTQLELNNGTDAIELNKCSIIIGFIANTITVRRSDGCLISHYVPPFIAGLIRCTQKNNWNQAIRICRTIKEDFLWATLAALAIAEKNLTVAETCYGQLQEAEKVLFLEEIRTQPNALLQAGLFSQFVGNAREAEAALLKVGRYFRAIMLNLGMFRFDRALELAIKSDCHVDTVLGYRQRYLALLGRKENDPIYLKHLSKVEIDWPHIFEKTRKDEEKDQHKWDKAIDELTIPN